MERFHTTLSSNVVRLIPPGAGHSRAGKSSSQATAPLAEKVVYDYIAAVNHLTKQEIFVICIVLGLLATGRCVKAYRTAHPAAAPVQTARP